MPKRNKPLTVAEYVSPIDAATLLSCSRSHIYRMLAAGTLPALKAGTRTLIPVAAVRAYIASLPPAHFGNGARVQA